MIGDCNPHGPNYPLNTQKIDWRTECGLLKEEGIRVYAVQALNRKEATKFYRELATKTDGFHLHLDQFSSIVNFMMAICFKEEGGDTLNNYETEVVGGEKKLNRELHRLFATLQVILSINHQILVSALLNQIFQGREVKSGFGGGEERPDGLVPVDPSRFQVLHVEARCSIKDFVLENSLIFKTGRGFYEFTKPEIVSHKKEVVLVDRATGDMFTGREAADMIGGILSVILPAFVKTNLSPFQPAEQGESSLQCWIRGEFLFRAQVTTGFLSPTLVSFMRLTPTDERPKRRHLKCP